ncbi:MAG: DoxX protein [Gemmatimonadota bacterium]|nr:DoxX protein [Gemmatimonadota bacterium]
MILHERWFTDEARFPVQLDRWSAPGSLVPIAIAVGITAAATLIYRARGRQSVVPGPIALGMSWENYIQLLTWVPLVIGVHMGVTLLVSGVSRQLFVPNLELPVNLLGGVLGMAEIGIALAFIYGALARPAAAALGLVWLAGALLFGPLRLIEHTEILGIAFFLFATGRGPLAFDMALEKLHKPLAPLIPYAVPVLRVSLGIGLVIVAFTEKLWNIPMGLAFLAEHHFNFFPAIGLGAIDDTRFLLIAGTVELTLGLMLIAGTYVRLIILITLVPFNLTLPFLGWRELVGHLPTYGILALLLLWGDERPGEEGALVKALSGTKETRSKSA